MSRQVFELFSGLSPRSTRYTSLRQCAFADRHVFMENTLPDRLLKRITKEANGCWTYNGPRSGHGYGSMWHDGRTRRTHRVAYEATYGDIPQNLEIDHICNNRLCCNPQHLRLVTRQHNAKLRSKRQTHCRHGHEYTPDNTYIEPQRGWRQCKTCRESWGKSGNPSNASKTHCKRGHELTGDNVKRDQMGRRYCRECTKLRYRAEYHNHDF